MHFAFSQVAGSACAGKCVTDVKKNTCDTHVWAITCDTQIQLRVGARYPQCPALKKHHATMLNIKCSCNLIALLLLGNLTILLGKRIRVFKIRIN